MCLFWKIDLSHTGLIKYYLREIIFLLDFEKYPFIFGQICLKIIFVIRTYEFKFLTLGLFHPSFEFDTWFSEVA